MFSERVRRKNNGGGEGGRICRRARTPIAITICGAQQLFMGIASHWSQSMGNNSYITERRRQRLSQLVSQSVSP